ncbi:hypothetical protein [Streptomyces sp. 3213.3]|uniref:hypothetical protein n=1 Tax=Streptomyces sp. 3213.3 TaxID=1855348 RepID=UPI0010427BCA|nr:hypothetical protein [Streptomyces sp. 3213.3]
MLLPAFVYGVTVVNDHSRQFFETFARNIRAFEKKIHFVSDTRLVIDLTCQYVGEYFAASTETIDS